MKIAKEFNWEMGHRLPFHEGKCKNIHGHSYKAVITFEGELDSNGMLIDYYDVKKIVNPFIDELDHAFMVHSNDSEMIDALNRLNSKKVVVDFHSTAENICQYLINKIKEAALPSNVKEISVRVYETYDDYAEESAEINNG